jgi:hypothetical protein
MNAPLNFLAIAVSRSLQWFGEDASDRTRWIERAVWILEDHLHLAVQLPLFPEAQVGDVATGESDRARVKWR